MLFVAKVQHLKQEVNCLILIFFYVPSKPFTFFPPRSITILTANTADLQEAASLPMPSVLPTEGVSVDSELRTILCHALLWASERLSRLPTGGPRLSAAAELVGFEKLPRTPGDPMLQFSCRKIRAAFFAAAWSSFCPSVKDLKVRPIGGFYTAATSPLIAVHFIASFTSALVFFSSYSDHS